MLTPFLPVLNDLLGSQGMEFDAEGLDGIGPQFPHTEREVEPLGGLGGL